MANNVLKIRPIADEFNLTSTIYTKLKQAIATMNIYDADVELKLDERSLSEQFGISRTPLREALARLDQEGLVRIVPRRGIYIVRKSKEEILDMILAWAALESMAARLVTQVASDEEIGALRKIVGKVDKDRLSANLDEYSELNIKFHQTILELSKSEQLFKMADEILMHVRAIRARTIGEGDRATKSVVDHMHIIEAIESRDADLAARLVREHTLNLREHVALNFHID
ncbi:MAG: GntR family transcriptional regulator [Hyphomicrobiales bacterium]|nr:GntR family transcriptional regulator [Hyphomicrobiales bacterium]